MIFNKKIFLIIFLLIFLFFAKQINSQTINSESSSSGETLEAVILKVIEEKNIKINNNRQLYQKLELEIISGSLKNKIITVENGNLPMANSVKYKSGDKVLLNYSKDAGQKDLFYITDYVRRDPIIWLFIIFVVAVIIVVGIQGVLSLLAMIYTFIIIFVFILPRILSGSEPIIIAVIGSILIIPVSFGLSHGLSRKTFAAIIGTVIALILTGLLALIFIDAAHLTGYASEEAAFLQVYKQGIINIKGLLMAGIIIGVLGVLDDITISQAAIVFQLKEANPKIKTEELFIRAMRIGKDHISSMVNTLVLVYTGAALPLFLLFTDSSLNFLKVINFEIVADEIIRTLVGSIGLIMAVPVTTVIACYMAYKKL